MISKALIVSGPTVEPIDPVRYISNHSSGKSGYALAEEALKRGLDEVIFITGPTHLIPDGVKLVQINTALEMFSEVMNYFPEVDVLIMAAAVADYRPLEVSEKKIKKHSEEMHIKLVKNPDILKEACKLKSRKQLVVGYAAETDKFLENGKAKMESKGADMIVLNHISSDNPVFGKEDNEVYLLTKKGTRKVDRRTKDLIASEVWSEIDLLFKNRGEKS